MILVLPGSDEMAGAYAASQYILCKPALARSNSDIDKLQEKRNNRRTARGGHDHVLRGLSVP